MENKDVRKWQYFLIGQGYPEVGEADKVFGANTLNATKHFQADHELEPDGIVGNKTVGKAMTLGFGVILTDEEGKLGSDWPAKPEFRPLRSTEERQEVFGEFAFVHEPRSDNPEHIRITDNWQEENIIVVDIPQLIQINGTSKVAFHKLAATQLQQLWQDWEDEGLLHLVISWHGSFVPRFIRGSRSSLSNHAFGTAFDINLNWNRLGVEPALVGRKGSVRELVKIANDNGFYWGGHFRGRPDGMHFEVAEVKG